MNHFSNSNQTSTWQAFQGWMAYSFNLPIEKNPHPAGSWEHDDWSTGWNLCKAEAARREGVAA